MRYTDHDKNVPIFAQESRNGFRHFGIAIHINSLFVDAMRGRQAVLLETVDNLAATGSLELSGVVWTARSADGSVIPAGTVVTVQGVEGVKLLVLPVKQ